MVIWWLSYVLAGPREPHSYDWLAGGWGNGEIMPTVSLLPVSWQSMFMWGRVLKTASKTSKTSRGLSWEAAQCHICCFLFVIGRHMAGLKGQGNWLHPLVGVATKFLKHIWDLPYQVKFSKYLVWFYSLLLQVFLKFKFQDSKWAQYYLAHPIHPNILILIYGREYIKATESHTIMNQEMWMLLCTSGRRERAFWIIKISKNLKKQKSL